MPIILTLRIANMWLLITFLTVWISIVHGQGKCIFYGFKNEYSRWRGQKYFQGESMRAECDTGFSLPNGESIMTCTENGWSPEPRCVRVKSCDRPALKNAVTKQNGTRFKLKDQLEYECKPGYENKKERTNGSIVCDHNGWSDQPACFAPCARPVFENATTQSNGSLFKINENLDYDCHPGHENKHGNTAGSIVCGDNGWSDEPTCFKKCGRPPVIDNGDITSMPLKEYSPGSSVEYQCQLYYKLQGNKTIKCTDGQWPIPPKCLGPCILSEDIMNKHNIQLHKTDGTNIYFRSGELIEFMCQSGYKEQTPPESFQAKCMEGKLMYPTCT